MKSRQFEGSGGGVGIRFGGSVGGGLLEGNEGGLMGGEVHIRFPPESTASKPYLFPSHIISIN